VEKREKGATSKKERIKKDQHHPRREGKGGEAPVHRKGTTPYFPPSRKNDALGNLTKKFEGLGYTSSSGVGETVGPPGKFFFSEKESAKRGFLVGAI